MAISQDASTPGANTGTISPGTLTVTVPASGSFSPPGQSLLVAVVSMGRGTATPSLSISDTGSHTWNAGPHVNGSNTSVWIYWAYLPGGATGIRVSVTNSTSEGQGIQLDLRVLNGAAAIQAGAGSNTNTGTSATWTGSLTTTTPNSWVMIAAAGNAAEATVTPNGNTSTLNNYQISGQSSQLSGEQAAPTGTPGATAFGWTVSSSTAFAWAALEILPANPSIDLPVINPGPAWLAYFKPGRPRPRPPVPQPWTSAVQASTSILFLLDEGGGPILDEGGGNIEAESAGWSLAPLTFAAYAGVSNPDQREILPGPTWLGLFKPGLPRPRPFVPVTPPRYGFGQLKLAPLAFTGTVSQSGPDRPAITPGPTWLSLFKPQWPKPRPPVPPAIPPPPVYATGGLALAPPLAFSGTAANRGLLFLFLGPYAVYYLDYENQSTQQVLFCVPGSSYSMFVASGRAAGLSDPPRDGRWLGYPAPGFMVALLADRAAGLHQGRAHNSARHARMARGEKIPPPEEPS